MACYVEGGYSMMDGRMHKLREGGVGMQTR
jgi:hypothetical protein